ARGLSEERSRDVDDRLAVRRGLLLDHDVRALVEDDDEPPGAAGRDRSLVAGDLEGVAHALGETDAGSTGFLVAGLLELHVDFLLIARSGRSWFRIDARPVVGDDRDVVATVVVALKRHGSRRDGRKVLQI